MKIETLIKGLRNPCLAIYFLAKTYIERYEGFTYAFKKNGEEYLLNRLCEEDIRVVFDVGANVGEWTKIALAKFPKAQVFGFEISQKTFNTLQDNLKGESRVALHNFGLSNDSGLIQYKDYGANSGVNTIIGNLEFHDFSIQPRLLECSVMKGDDFCKENGIESIDLLKIDVEGAEFMVLEGFANMLKNNAIRIIQFEYGYANGDTHTLMKDFFRLLGDYGYVTGPLKKTGVLFMDFVYPLNDFNSGPNFVSLLSNDEELISHISGKSIEGYPG